MKTMIRIGSAFFVLWGLVHVLGGTSILLALHDGADAAYAAYRNSSGAHDALSGSILGYFAYLLVCIGMAVAVVGATLNRRNSRAGLAINTAVVAVTEIGLLYFLVVPGFVSWGEASVGLVPFVLAAVASGIPCRSAHSVSPAR